jgi:hypothetical protein
MVDGFFPLVVVPWQLGRILMMIGMNFEGECTD